MKVLITGASKGIGAYLYEKMKADARFEVYGTYCSTPSNDELIHLDVANQESVDTAIEKLGDIEELVVVNCAGISYNSFAHKADIDRWQQVIDVNLVGTFRIIRSVLPLMRQHKFGRIINFSSVVASLPTPGVSAYAASKAALDGLAKSISAENAALGITINNLNLGYTNAGMGVNDVPEEYRQKMMSAIPTGRFCEPSEILNLIICLIDTPYINGASIDINGALN